MRRRSPPPPGGGPRPRRGGGGAAPPWARGRQDGSRSGSGSGAAPAASPARWRTAARALRRRLRIRDRGTGGAARSGSGRPRRALARDDRGGWPPRRAQTARPARRGRSRRVAGSGSAVRDGRRRSGRGSGAASATGSATAEYSERPLKGLRLRSASPSKKPKRMCAGCRRRWPSATMPGLTTVPSTRHPAQPSWQGSERKAGLVLSLAPAATAMVPAASRPRGSSPRGKRRRLDVRPGHARTSTGSRRAVLVPGQSAGPAGPTSRGRSRPNWMSGSSISSSSM